MLPASKPPSGSQKFSPEKRLHYPWEYRKFFGTSEVFRASECTIFRIPNARGHFRLGVTLKARGNSVERNRTKRRIREAFRHLEPQSLGSFDYNVVVPGNRRMDHIYVRRLAKCLREEFPGLLRRGGVPAKPKPGPSAS